MKSVISDILTYGFIGLFVIMCLIGFVPACTTLGHKYDRWHSKVSLETMSITEETKIREKEVEGKRRLESAEWEKKILIADARAKLEASEAHRAVEIAKAKADAQVEIERAKGVAEANKIIADSLKGNEAYLRYLWVNKLHEGNQVIYIPTEAGLPILEAGKR